MKVNNVKEPYFGLRGKWLTFWITVSSELHLAADLS